MPRRTDSRQRIISAAGSLVRRQGYAATGWRQVIAESGAPWGSQAHHFPGGKEQLVSEALAAEGERMRGRIAAGLDAMHPADMLLAWRDGAIAELRASGWSDGCPVATTALETAHDSDELAAVCHRVFQSWQRELLQAMRARGVDAAEARRLAALVIAALEGGLLLAKTARDGRPLVAVVNELATLLRERVPRLEGVR